jgi:hypothetical protein
LSSVQPAVDAIVIHPPQIEDAPTNRRPVFAEHMTRISGVWEGGHWPVVVAAFSDGEPDIAIALDQVLLRRGETEFELWFPANSYEIRVFDSNGRVAIDLDLRQSPLRIELK